MIQLSDGTVIAQKRNNAVTLTQYAGLSASASGAVSIFEITDGSGIELLQANAVAEVVEELGINPKKLPYFPDISDITEKSIQHHILREINLDHYT